MLSLLASIFGVVIVSPAIKFPSISVWGQWYNMPLDIFPLQVKSMNHTYYILIISILYYIIIILAISEKKMPYIIIISITCYLLDIFRLQVKSRNHWYICMVYCIGNLIKFNLFSIVELRFYGNKQRVTKKWLEKKAVLRKNYIYL